MSWFGIKTMCGLAMAGSVVFGTAESRACTCLDGTLLWPDTNSDVALDSTFVFGFITGLRLARLPEAETGTATDAGAEDAGLDDAAGEEGDPDQPPAPGLVLQSEHGDWIELSGIRELAGAGCIGDVYILAPATQLDPNTTYTFRNGVGSFGTFTTGDQLVRESSPESVLDELEWGVLGTAEDPSLIAGAFITGITEVPFLVSWQGQLDETRLVRFDPAMPQTGTFTINVAEVECPQVELVGVDGETWESRILCEPDRCMSDPPLSMGTCEDNPILTVSYDEFLELPVDCGVEAELPPPSVNEVDPAPDEGCAFSSRGSSNDSPPWAVLALGAVAAAVSRRRVQ